MARHVVILDVEDPTLCVVCMYPAVSCICDAPEILRAEEMRRIWHRGVWLTAILDGARRIWARLRHRR